MTLWGLFQSVFCYSNEVSKIRTIVKSRSFSTGGPKIMGVQICDISEGFLLFNSKEKAEERVGLCRSDRTEVWAEPPWRERLMSS